MNKSWDVIVVGGGHAGIEAAHASAKMGANTLLISSNLDLIGHMPCNPSIGGVGKGQLVKEIDALGGLMGLAADQNGLQFRRLNTKKGPAVQSSRSQADKIAYRTWMQRALTQTLNLTLIQDNALELIHQNGRVIGVKGAFRSYNAKAVVVTPGTFLNGVIRIGEWSQPAGRMGEGPSSSMPACFADLGITLRRFKTGTPPRLDVRSIRFDVCEIQNGDNPPRPFSFRTPLETFNPTQYPCWLTHTSPRTHDIIAENIHRAPMYSGDIDATGVRYCPSIEDKVMKFPDKERHHVFLEPESLSSGEIYPNGLSNALPLDVQEELYQSIPGLENALIIRPAYAVEHDYADPTQLTPWLEVKHVENLFLGGQINGTTGYEEAAASGLVAGINAAARVHGKAPVVFSRTNSYIGVMIDDLTTLGTIEPYRMFTSRAEYRLIVREDNADMRLSHLGYELGILSKDAYQILETKQKLVEEGLDELKNIQLTPSAEWEPLFSHLNTPAPPKRISAAEILRRPEVDYETLCSSLMGMGKLSKPQPFLVGEQISIEIKYEGYISEDLRRIQEVKDAESLTIPENFPYERVSGLRLEEIEKLSKLRPTTFSQISRLPGIRPAALQILALVLKFGGDKGLNEYSVSAPEWGHSSSDYKKATENKAPE
ncbi:MAG: tRNA uridine-5-carboxymethylaminomethyl(34) synthesis enzyme MnmG [Brevinema sp.]